MVQINIFIARYKENVKRLLINSIKIKIEGQNVQVVLTSYSKILAYNPLKYDYIIIIKCCTGPWTWPEKFPLPPSPCPSSFFLSLHFNPCSFI